MTPAQPKSGAKAAKLAVQGADERSIDAVYNVNNPDNPSWKEFLAAAAEAMDVAPPGRHLPYPVALAAAGAMELAARLSGGEPCFKPLNKGFVDTRITLKAEDQGHVDTDAVADQLAHSRQPFHCGRHLDHEVGAVNCGVQTAGFGNGGINRVG